MKIFLIATQIAVSLSVLNVWLLRRQIESAWRGGSARNLSEEFAVYGLPAWMFPAVGSLKITCALLLLAGLFFTDVVRPAAACLALLMLAAVVMHVKIADPIRKALPAAALFALTLAIAAMPR